VNYYNDLCAASITPKELFYYQYQRGLKVLEFLEVHQEVINFSRVSTILEIGTGTGGILKAIKDKYPHLKAFGTEYRDEEISIAKKNGIATVKGDIETFINENGGKIDLIILNHVMEHFIDISDELEKIRRIMHEHSVLLVGVPGVMHTHKFYESFLESISLDHNYFFTSRTLNYIMNKNGFKHLYIDEDVNALYKLSGTYQHDVPRDEYERVTHYLGALEKKANRPLAKLRSLRVEYRQLLKNVILNIIDKR
jgi:SAM-dependent methyltransferase